MLQKFVGEIFEDNLPWLVKLLAGRGEPYLSHSQSQIRSSFFNKGDVMKAERKLKVKFE
jgi:hypothetical protein